MSTVRSWAAYWRAHWEYWREDPVRLLRLAFLLPFLVVGAATAGTVLAALAFWLLAPLLNHIPIR